MAAEEDEQTLTARAVLASLLLGTEPPWLPTPALIRGAGLFGIAEGAARTALSRMTVAGEVAAEGVGYRLRGRLLDRHARQRTSRLAETAPWEGSWRMAVIVGGARSASDRASLRAAMNVLRLAGLRDGAWMRPDNLVGWPSGIAADVVAAQCRWLSAVPDDDPVALAAELWDLAGWSRTAEALLAELARLIPALDARDHSALAPGFLRASAVLRHLQADPLLPPRLLRPGWPGAALRRTYDAFDHAYRAAMATSMQAAQRRGSPGPGSQG